MPPIFSHPSIPTPPPMMTTGPSGPTLAQIAGRSMQDAGSRGLGGASPQFLAGLTDQAAGTQGQGGNPSDAAMQAIMSLLGGNRG